MTNEKSHSLNVIDAFKRHKLAASALHKIADTIRGFEEDRKANWKIARAGLVFIIVLLAIAAYYFFNREGLTLPL